MKFYIVSCLIILSGFSFGQKTLSLNEAVKIALQKNSGLLKANNNLLSLESNLKTSYGSLLPTLNASTGWDWSKNDRAGGPVSFSGLIINLPASSTQERSYSGALNGSWTLFDGLSNFASISQSEYTKEAGELSLARLKEEIVFSTVSAYYDILNAEKQLQVKIDNLEWNKKNFEIIQERNKLGSVTLADVYAQQVRLGNAELELIQTQNDFETLKSNFLYALGLDVLDNYNFVDPSISSGKNLKYLDTFSSIDEDLNVLVEKALYNRSDYKSSQFSLFAAQKGITIAKSGHFPRLTNSFGFRTNANSIGNLFDNKTYSIGLTLSIPIFSGFAVENRVQLAEVNLKNKQIELSDLERDIKRNLKKIYLDFQASVKRVEVSEKNVTAASENRRIEEEKYSLGATTLLNVLIANSEYTNALSNYINAQFQYLKLKEQLKFYLGQLEFKNYE